MIYRAYTSEDLAAVVRLFQETVHTVCAADYTPVPLDAWAPNELDLKRSQATLLAHHTIVAEEGGVIAEYDSTFQRAVGLLAAGELFAQQRGGARDEDVDRIALVDLEAAHRHVDPPVVDIAVDEHAGG